MKLQKPNTPPKEMTTEQLRDAIDSIRELSVDVVEYLSAVLAELKARREPHDFFQDRILRFWREINEGQLSAEAAIYLANRHTIKAILPLPHSEQIDIAKGRLVPVATLTSTGEIKSDDIPILRMDPATLKRAFGPEGIRTVHEQAEMIRAEGKIERIGAITVLKDEGVFKIGNQKITPQEIQRVAPMLGYRLVLARNVDREVG